MRQLTLAGIVVAVMFGVVTRKLAWATPGAAVTSTVISGAVLLDEIDTKGESDSHEVEIKASGDWEMRVIRFSFEAGGHTGWHSHPGPVFVMVTAGTLTLYQADDPDNPTEYQAGEGFVEDAGRAHLAANKGNEVLKLDAFFLLPLGAAPRTDEPAPN